MMMRKQVAGIVLAFSVAGGAGAGVLAKVVSSQKPPVAVTATPTSPDQFIVSPGAVGPVVVGMSKSEGMATGYFVAGTPPVAGECPALPLVWKDDYAEDFDVQTLGNGEIVSIGVRGRSIQTAEGVGVGSTYDEVHAAYPQEVLVEAGYGQSGLRVFDSQDGGWIGFLFDPPVDKIEGNSPVTFVEVTKGGEPSLMRDGC